VGMSYDREGRADSSLKEGAVILLKSVDMLANCLMKVPHDAVTGLSLAAKSRNVEYLLFSRAKGESTFAKADTLERDNSLCAGGTLSTSLEEDMFLWWSE
jgi:hypothetical protein